MIINFSKVTSISLVSLLEVRWFNFQLVIYLWLKISKTLVINNVELQYISIVKFSQPLEPLMTFWPSNFQHPICTIQFTRQR